MIKKHFALIHADEISDVTWVDEAKISKQHIQPLHRSAAEVPVFRYLHIYSCICSVGLSG